METTNLEESQNKKSKNNLVEQGTKKVVKQVVKTKVNILTLKAKLIIAGAIVALLFLIALVMLFVSTISSVLEDDTANQNNGMDFYGTANVSAEVEQYRDDIQRELEKYGQGQYTNLILALMMQESGGRGNDPMQASESKCGYIGCITSPSESITYGVKHFLHVLESAGEDIKLTLQSYNFGGGFINYVMQNGGAYTKELAISFSQMMYQKLAHTGIYKCHRPSAIANNACYGDIEYVDAVLKYLPSAATENVVIAEGDFKIVFDEMQKYAGFKYVFGGANPTTSFDCSGLMQWAFKKIGIKLPRTAEQQYKFAKPISPSEAQVGDLVFFVNTYKPGVSHVGVYVGNGMMYDTHSNPKGVGYTDITTGYWAEKFHSFGRVVDFK